MDLIGFPDSSIPTELYFIIPGIYYRVEFLSKKLNSSPILSGGIAGNSAYLVRLSKKLNSSPILSGGIAGNSAYLVRIFD